METIIIENKPVSQNFLPKPILIDHYVLGDGSLSAQVLMPDGHGWGKHLPLGETQLKNGIDPQSCPVGGTNNIIEAIGNKKFNEKLNYKAFQDDLSEMYGSIAMGMSGHGGNPHDYAEGVRTLYGCIPEAFLPFDKGIDTVEKFFKPRPLPYSLFKYGYSWKQKYTLGHQWIITGNEPVPVKISSMKQALKYSPVGVAGYAWSLRSDGKYYNDGPAIHWFVIFDYVEDDHWLAFDSYSPNVKKLDWNYNFAYAKGYTLERNLGGENINLEKPRSCLIPYILYRIKNLFNKS